MRIKALKTIINHGDAIAIGSVAEMDADTVKAFGPEYVEVLEEEKAETTETQPKGEEKPKPDEKPETEETTAKKVSKKK